MASGILDAGEAVAVVIPPIRTSKGTGTGIAGPERTPAGLESEVLAGLNLDPAQEG